MFTTAFLALRKGLSRIARGVLPRSTFEFLRYYAYGKALAVVRPTHPVVETFAGSDARDTGERIRSTLEAINASRPTRLCWMMKRRGSDKGLAWHNYSTVYHALFTMIAHREVRVFELGLGTNNPNIASSMGEAGKPGASLRGWADFFPRGAIFGADIDRDTLFREGPIDTYYCDQLDRAAIAELWSNPALRGEFDILIEDGLHTWEANTCFLEASLHKVRRGGFYVIEDIINGDLPKWREQLRAEYGRRYADFSFFIVAIPWHYNSLDNNLIVAYRAP